MDHPDRQTEERQKMLRDARAIKAFLKRSDTLGGPNLYDHLTRLLTRVTDERPTNVMDVIEDMSLEIKQSYFFDDQRTMPNLPEPTGVEELAEHHRLLFRPPEDPEEELVDARIPNLNEINFYMEQGGVGLGRMEMQRIFLGMKQLAQSEQLPYCRLWGKILGRESNYIIAEAVYKDGEDDDEQRLDKITEEEETTIENEDNEKETVRLPLSTYKPQPAVPKEDIGTGANKFAYYVCKEPGFPWTKLPSVSPAQITAARQIRKYFTGRLDSPIMSYPPFPGNEANYLRAQIARISAGTHVSPMGFYQAKEEDEEEEEEAAQTSNESMNENPEFEGIPVSEMVTSLSSWVHHVQHILPQGRCTWVNMAVNQGEGWNDKEENEDLEEELEEPEREIGPSLLTPLSQDAGIFNTPTWTLKLSSSLTPDHAVAVLRSNIWPGAHAYSCGTKFENLYVGWGLKYAGEAYSPPMPPPPQDEYPSREEIMEALDPTVKEEVEFRAAKEEQEESQEEVESSDEDDDEDDN